MGHSNQGSEAPLKVWLVHNAYQQRGGEDSVVEAEMAMLRARGHEVALYLRHNEELSRLSKLSVATQAFWSARMVEDLNRQVERDRPDVIHVHNTLPLVSPSVFWAAARLGVPVVQTLHNFRLMCPQAMFVRDGVVCEDCLGRVPWRGVMRGCYRGSVAQTGILAASVTLHGLLGTYAHKVDRYIVLNEFCRAKFVEGGLPSDRLRVKPNFVPWREAPPHAAVRSGGLYLGRLTREKGLDVLLRALAIMGGDGLSVIGDGPMAPEVAASLGERFLGFKPLEQVWAHLESASFLVVPSVWYEGFPRTIVEAYSCGVPVLASRLGSLAEVVEDGVTGLLFTPGDAHDLAAKMAWAKAHPEEMARMGRRAREVYEQRYTPQINGAQLESIYREVMAERCGSALGGARGTSPVIG